MLLAICGGSYYFYHYNYVEVVTDYYSLTYQQPHEEESFLGKRYSNTKVDISSIKHNHNSNYKGFEQMISIIENALQ